MGKMNGTRERLEEKPQKEGNMKERGKEEPAFAAADKERIGRGSPSYTESRSIGLDPEVLTANRCIGFSLDVPEVEAYRLLRTKILQRALEKGGNTLMVTSAVPGEGKTLTAVNLAFVVAKEFNQTVLLVDCDLRQQNVYKMLGIPSKKGLADYILDLSPLEDLILWPGVEKMTLISGGQTPEGSSELLGSPRMKGLVAELKTRYPDRFVIFDLPPVLSTADALGFAPLVDHVVMVVQAGKTPLPDVKKALEMLPREKILGIVLNRHEGIQKSYYYGYYHKNAGEKKKPAAPEIRDLFQKKGEGRFPEILKKIQIGFLSRWGKEREKNALTGKILLASIVLIAVLAAVGYYFAANRSDSTRPGEVNRLSGQSGKTPPLPGGVSPEAAPPKEITASVQEQPAPAESKPTSPPPPSVSSEPPGPATIPQPVPAAKPQETQAADGKEGEKPGKGPEIAKKPSVKKAEVPQKKDFFAIKILALADPKRTQAFVEQQKKKGYDVHSRTVSIKDKGVMQQIFLGHFGSQGEALRFLNEKKIRQSYPDSVIMKLTR